MSELLLDRAGRDSTPGVRRTTRDCGIRPIRPRSRRSSASCAPQATVRTAAGYAP
jgi:hypothetical protein